MKFSNPLQAVILVGFAYLMGCTNKAGNPTTDKSSAGIIDLTEMKKRIREKNDAFTNAHITGDTATLINYFTKDAKVFAPHAEVVAGRAAIAKLNKEYIGYEIKEFSEETTDFYGNEDLLIDEGAYLMRYGKNNTVEKGKYINVWKKEGADWRVSSNIWNSSLAAR